MQSAGSNSGDVLQDLHSKCHFAFRCQTALTKKQNHVKVDVSSGLQGIGHLRTKTDTVAQIQRIQSLPMKRERKQMQTQLGTSCKPNPMLELAVDPHQYVVCIYNAFS